MSQSVAVSSPEPSQFLQTARDPDKRLQWIREHLGEEAYLEAKAQRERNERSRQKTRQLEESMQRAGWLSRWKRKDSKEP